MGKISKHQLPKHSNHHDNPNRAKKAVLRRQHSQIVSRNKKQNLTARREQAGSKSNSNHQPKSSIQFSKWDRVLLVGEGDFTFSLSLATTHQVGNIVATCFDSRDVLEQKYPGVDRTIRELGSPSKHIKEHEEKLNDRSNDVNHTDNAWEGFSPGVQSEDEEHDHGMAIIETPSPTVKTTVFYDIDATKLNSKHKKVLRPYSPFTKIVFNFPHVGGVSTDVNRQVRSNQQLLVNFFSAAKPLLATAAMPARLVSTVHNGEVPDDETENDSDFEDERSEYLKHGKILVTLFEGEPYTLWNIRDLARHSGLKVLESFKFPWTAYPGYQHARTIGDITSGKDRSDEGKRKGAWRGEERDARCYVLVLKDDDDGRPAPGSRKRRHVEDDSD